MVITANIASSSSSVRTHIHSARFAHSLTAFGAAISNWPLVGHSIIPLSVFLFATKRVAPTSVAGLSSLSDTERMHLSFGNLVVEFFGTGMLCFTVAATTVQDNAMAPVAIGLVLSVLSYSGSHLSGAMYNPAVALALVIRGGLPIVAFTPYVLAQLVGAYSGGALSLIHI